VVGTAADALVVAQSTVGRKESPPGSNICPPFTDPIPGQPWCAAWCDWVLRQVGWTLRTITPNPFYVPAIVAGAKKAGVWFPASAARPGDLACFDWQRDGITDHIGMVVINRPPTSDMLTIEGNTAFGNDSNGGQVMNRTRRWAQVAGVVRPPYSAGPPPPIPAPVVPVRRDDEEDTVTFVIDPTGGIWAVSGLTRKAQTGSPQEVVQRLNRHRFLGGRVLDTRAADLRPLWDDLVATTVVVRD
jgi:hypothetical protein